MAKQKLKGIETITCKGYSSKDKAVNNKFLSLVTVSTDGMTVREEGVNGHLTSINSAGASVIDNAGALANKSKTLKSNKKDFSGKFIDRFEKMYKYVSDNKTFTEGRLKALKKFIDEDTKELQAEMKKNADVDKYIDQVRNNNLDDESKDGIIEVLTGMKSSGKNVYEPIKK